MRDLVPKERCNPHIKLQAGDIAVREHRDDTLEGPDMAYLSADPVTASTVVA